MGTALCPLVPCVGSGSPGLLGSVWGRGLGAEDALGGGPRGSSASQGPRPGEVGVSVHHKGSEATTGGVPTGASP